MPYKFFFVNFTTLYDMLCKNDPTSVVAMDGIEYWGPGVTLPVWHPDLSIPSGSCPFECPRYSFSVNFAALYDMYCKNDPTSVVATDGLEYWGPGVTLPVLHPDLSIPPDMAFCNALEILSLSILQPCMTCYVKMTKQVLWLWMVLSTEVQE